MANDEPVSRNEEVMAGLLKVRERATAFSYAVLHDFHAAEDAVQEASLVAVRRASGYSGEGFNPWFWTILRNVLGTRMRAAQKAPVVARERLLELLGETALREAEPAEEENVDRLIECLQKMGETMSRVFRMRFQENKSCGDISRRLGRSVQATYAMIKRGRQALRQCVELRANG